MVGDCSTSDEVLVNSVRNRETLLNWDCMRNTISGINDTTRGSTVSIKRKNGLDCDIHSWNLESLKHQLGHLLSVCFWVHRGLSKEYIALGGINFELIIEAIIPNFFHLIPVCNYSRLDWVVQIKDTSHLIGLITNVFRFRLNTENLLF